MTFWATPTFHEYERLCGDEPGTRARLLASADFMTRVVDLSLSEAELWRGVRKSYRSLIHAAERSRELCLWYGRDEGCIVDLGRELHQQAAGRATRPLQTWALMGEWVRDRRALMLTCGYDKTETEVEDDGYIYCVIHGKWSYYFSGVTLNDNLSHALIWHAMKVLKSCGVRWFELGWMEREGDDEKARGICRFKRGFGGSDIPACEAPKLCAAMTDGRLV